MKKEEDFINDFLKTLTPEGMGTKIDRDLPSVLKSIPLEDEEGKVLSKDSFEKKITDFLKNYELSHLQQEVKKEINKYAAKNVSGTPEKKLANARNAIIQLCEKNSQKKEDSFKSTFSKETPGLFLVI